MLVQCICFTNKLAINMSKQMRRWPSIFSLGNLLLFFVFLFFLAFDFCRFCVVIRFFHPRHNGQWPPTLKDFTRFYPLHYFLILILEKEPVFPFSMLSALNKGTTGTIVITSLVWRGPWLGIEPGTSRTRSQHYITRLSRRRYLLLWKRQLF